MPLPIVVLQLVPQPAPLLPTSPTPRALYEFSSEVGELEKNMVAFLHVSEQ